MVIGSKKQVAQEGSEDYGGVASSRILFPFGRFLFGPPLAYKILVIFFKPG
jgi:hypothetical protein